MKSDNSLFESYLAVLLSFIMFSVTVTSCAPTWVISKTPGNNNWWKPTTAIVCVDVSEKQKHEVYKAIRSWDKSINKWKKLIPMSGIYNNCDYTIQEVDPPIDGNPFVLAMTSDILGHEIELYRGRYEIDTLGIVLHELGHAFGARHMEGTLMAPHIKYKAFNCPDAATIAQVAVMNNVDPLLLSWCVKQHIKQ